MKSFTPINVLSSCGVAEIAVKKKKEKKKQLSDNCEKENTYQ